eukprot:TRINITY_DN18446_c0_g1_i1.p1 TRINITY_DN18446_c0_g1~~TRINITY_DN18446_c0_g1_i1.p1  ORF type:complete len:629 (-),score=131.25 TRINITY_DN18446_c0_g1_i1:113-1999(-)
MVAATSPTASTEKPKAKDKDSRVLSAKAPPGPRSSKARPGQAGRGAGTPQAQGRTLAQAQAAAANAARALDELKENCRVLKASSNAIAKETLMVRTRLRAMEPELQKREKVLRSMITSHQMGTGLGIEIVEKLREERNLLPIFNRKVQALKEELEDREADIKRLKQDKRFTKIIELQVEYVTWKHESRRLDALLRPDLVDGEDDAAVATVDCEVHRDQVEKLKAELAAQETRQARVQEDLVNIEDDHKHLKANCDEKEDVLNEEKDQTRELAMNFKDLLQKVKYAEQLQSEIDSMALMRRKHEQQLKAIADGERQSIQIATVKQMNPSYCLVSAAAMHGELPVSEAMQNRTLSMRRAAARSRDAQSSLFEQLRLHDKDCDGLLSHDELHSAIRAWEECPVEPAEAVSILIGLLDEETCQSSFSWLDMLASLERYDCSHVSNVSPTSTPSSPSSPSQKLQTAELHLLPPMWPLRAACLRLGVSREELEERLQSLTSANDAQTLFNSLGLSPTAAASWLETWRLLGTSRMLLQLPLNEAALQADAYPAWSARCIDAVQKHRKELEDSFKVWNADSMMSEMQFSMACSDVCGLYLSPDDIRDLALFAGGDPDSERASVDGRIVLSIGNKGA